MHEFVAKKPLRKWIKPIFELINETYAPIYGFTPLEDKEIDELAARYLPVINPRFVKVVTDHQDNLIAFIISMPELSNGIRKARGRLLPFGLFYIIREAKRSRLLTLLLGAIKEEHRGKGLDSVMGLKIIESAKNAGITTLDSHLVLETNTKMRAEYEKMGGIIHKRFRIFQKEL